MRATQRGFTLVEIAIVLVIIGLLLGGILKGQEMIVQAKIKNAISELSGASAAYYGYRDRYRAIPGDDPNAATRWATPSAADSGNGNGVVEGLYNSTTAGDESREWWDHLRRAGFISGAGSQQPLNAFTGMIGVQTGDGTGTNPGPTLGGLTGLIICSSGLSDKVAIALDSQMDDGRSAAGTVRAQLHTGLNPNITGTAASDYQETGTNSYTVCRTL